MQKFLRLAENKIDLVEFIYRDWSTNENNEQTLENKEIYITVKNKAHCIKVIRGVLRSNPALELESEQEEADTKMFLCAVHAESMGFDKVKIVTVDSDVAILCIYRSLWIYQYI